MGGGLRERTGENFYEEASEHSLCNAGGWVAQGVPCALAGRPEMVLPLQPFACFCFGGSGELLGRSEGGPEGARGRSWESPRATFRGSEGSVSGLAEVCWHISGSSGHLGSWLSCREHDSSWFNIIHRGLNSSSKYSSEKSERAILILLTARSSFGVGGSGRSPVNPPTPRVRREGRPKRTDRRELLCGSVRK